MVVSLLPTVAFAAGKGETGYVFYTDADGNNPSETSTDRFFKFTVTKADPKEVSVAAANDITNACTIPSSVSDGANTYNVTSIANNGFTGKKLTSVTIPSSVTSIGQSAFGTCSELTSVTIPSSVTSIGQSAFSTCSKLTSVTIPASVTKIDKSAFANCDAVTTLHIDSIESWLKVKFSNAQSNPLNGSASGKKLYVNGSDTPITEFEIPNKVDAIPDYAFYGWNMLKNVTIPSSVTSINNYTFSGCGSLTSVTIPSSVTSIGNQVFKDCSALTTVNVKATNPPTLGTNLFGSSPASVPTIYVPNGTGETYKVASNWSTYSEYIKEAYMVDVAVAANGTVTVDKDWFPTDTYKTANETVNVTVTPDEGYQLKSLKYNDGTDHDITEAKSFTMPTANVTVTAEFAPTYGIISEVQGHGSVTTKIGDADVAKAAEGAEVVFTATADEGYQFKEWVDVRGNANISGHTTDNSLTVTMPAAEIKIKAVFEAIPPVGDTVTVQTNGHGTATAANVGGTVTLTPAPESGYGLKEWQVISGDLDASDIVNNQFTMPAGNVTIKAIFAPLYTVTAEVDGHGASAEASVASAVEGTKVTLTATAQEGYELDHWEVVSGGVTVENDEGYYFTMPAANVKVKAIFKAIEPGSYGIITEAQGHGNVTAKVGGETVTSAAKDASVVLTAVAEEGYQFKEWVDVRGNANLSSTTTNPITITMPAAEIKVKAVFEEKPPVICEYDETVKLSAGTFGMKLNCKDMGEFTFEQFDGGWSIYNGSKYLAMKDGKLALSDDPFAWTYKNGAFSASVKTTQKSSGYWFGFIYIPGRGSKTVTTTYYLSTVTENAKLSTCCVCAELYKTVTANEHDFGCWIDCKDGNHKHICKNCGEVETEEHSYDKDTHKCVCGAYDPSVADVKISVDVKEKTTKQFSGFLFWGTWKNVTTYTATIKTEATGVKVTKVQYQLNGGKWMTGTSVSSDKPIETLKVKAWDSNGNVHEYLYSNN